ncbi:MULTISPECIES: helix-turn-helix transcriptional regulator [Micromonospora]|uniref:XRE family transcriptional regulator n=1 Tax=Micromonospora solifontis TaxID=2487138 RepID=A0ABX9WGE4_9ACTN|nr:MULTISPECIES: helix-turn-helix transcriptional regulator [Micromonospora]NES15189.1 helix-turn-helix transcriptional regulator [Micromonospora sp. PPF5-17B]NES38145.1 helix-turn-helix transcriptional regulator [Micromonospora solifontis]NES56524.1 helix-turn-helix transcriptional regulator [Micromonospora sp. PPF5-6]RNL97002.1 XRE family transcriptional regulator [Micromonospora solifontis]
MSTLRHAELADFLRARRARVRPAEVGLPEGVRRRTPGLRRQEVAQLAGISIDYYIRIEQGRGPHPSRQVLAALARALLLSRNERAYLFRLAGESPPEATGPSREVPAGLRHLLDAMTDTPAYLVDAAYDVLAWNRLAAWFVGDLTAVPVGDRNMIRWMFRREVPESYWRDPEVLTFARTSIADLRAAYGRYPADPALAALVTELLGVSPRFAALWAEHEVGERRPTVKRVTHPELGPLEFECRVLHVPETDQRLIVYVPEPGSPTQAAFHRVGERTAAQLGT